MIWYFTFFGEYFYVPEGSISLKLSETYFPFRVVAREFLVPGGICGNFS